MAGGHFFALSATNHMLVKRIVNSQKNTKQSLWHGDELCRHALAIWWKEDKRRKCMYKGDTFFRRRCYCFASEKDGASNLDWTFFWYAEFIYYWEVITNHSMLTFFPICCPSLIAIIRVRLHSSRTLSFLDETWSVLRKKRNFRESSLLICTFFLWTLHFRAPLSWSCCIIISPTKRIEEVRLVLVNWRFIAIQSPCAEHTAISHINMSLDSIKIFQANHTVAATSRRKATTLPHGCFIWPEFVSPILCRRR